MQICMLFSVVINGCKCSTMHICITLHIWLFKLAEYDEPQHDETVKSKKVKRKRRGQSFGGTKEGGAKRNIARPCRSTANQKQATSESPELYKINMAELPFINGKVSKTVYYDCYDLNLFTVVDQTAVHHHWSSLHFVLLIF